MRDAAAAKGVQTGMGLQGRATPDLNQLRDLIANGYVGKVISASMLVTSGGGDSHPDREPKSVAIAQPESQPRAIAIGLTVALGVAGANAGPVRKLGDQPVAAAPADHPDHRRHRGVHPVAPRPGQSAAGRRSARRHRGPAADCAAADRAPGRRAPG